MMWPVHMISFIQSHISHARCWEFILRAYFLEQVCRGSKEPTVDISDSDKMLSRP